MNQSAKLHFYAESMQLYIESDLTYLALPETKSRIAGYFYLHTHPHLHKALRIIKHQSMSSTPQLRMLCRLNVVTFLSTVELP